MNDDNDYDYGFLGYRPFYRGMRRVPIGPFGECLRLTRAVDIYSRWLKVAV